MKVLIISVLIACLVFSAQAGRDGKCRALVMSGGGDKGAYQASALVTLIKNTPQIDTEYDVVSGVSAGSLNGVAFSAFAPGKEADYEELVMGVWHNIKASDAMRLWPGGIEEGLTDHSAIFDDAPLFDLLGEVLGPYTQDRYYIAGSSDMNTATFQAYHYPPTGEPFTKHTIESVVASSAMPGIFEYIERDGMVLLDGGVVWRSDSTSAIHKCQDDGYANEDIIVDFIICANKQLEEPGDLSEWHTWSHGMRALNIQSYYKTLTDVEQESSLFPGVNFRYTIAPSEKIATSRIPLDFGREHLERLIAVGEKDALDAIAMGEGGYKQALLDQFHIHEAGEHVELRDLIDMSLNRFPEME